MVGWSGCGDEEVDRVAGGEDGRGGVTSGELLLHTCFSLREEGRGRAVVAEAGSRRSRSGRGWSKEIRPAAAASSRSPERRCESHIIRF